VALSNCILLAAKLYRIVKIGIDRVFDGEADVLACRRLLSTFVNQGVAIIACAQSDREGATSV
jgi:hypothetical protein